MMYGYAPQYHLMNLDAAMDYSAEDLLAADLYDFETLNGEDEVESLRYLRDYKYELDKLDKQC